MTPRFSVYQLPEFPGKWLLQVRDSGPGFGDTIHPTREEAEREAELTRRREEYRAKVGREEAERKAREEAKAKADADFDGWEATLSPMARGKAISCLCCPIMADGRETTRKAIIREAVEAGAQVETVGGKPALVAPDGAFRWQSALTKLGLDYARHLISRRTP